MQIQAIIDSVPGRQVNCIIPAKKINRPTISKQLIIELMTNKTVPTMALCG
jgi:hypothetical protein